MACLGLEPGVAGWQAQMNPLSYGDTPSEYSLCKVVNTLLTIATQDTHLFYCVGRLSTDRPLLSNNLQISFLKWVNHGLFFLYVRSFHMANIAQILYMIKEQMVCLGLEPGLAGWQAQTNHLSYGGTPFLDFFLSIKVQVRLMEKQVESAQMCFFSKVFFY